MREMRVLYRLDIQVLRDMQVDLELLEMLVFWAGNLKIIGNDLTGFKRVSYRYVTMPMDLTRIDKVIGELN